METHWIKKRFAEINSLEPETPTNEDLEAIAKASAESVDNTLSLNEYKLSKQ